MVGIQDVINYANFGEDRLRGLGVAGGQSLPFSIHFDRRPYNTLASVWYSLYSVIVRLELSAGRTPSFIAECCNVFQALENSLVLVPELAHLRIFILRYTNVLIIMIIIVGMDKATVFKFSTYIDHSKYYFDMTNKPLSRNGCDQGHVTYF